MALSIDKPLAAFFSNSIPKSGTNLVKQLLLGMPGISHNNAQHTIYGHFDSVKAAKLRSIKQNQFGAGHIVYSQKWTHLFKELDMKQLIISRDPRDIVVSYVPFMKKFPKLSPVTSYIVNNLRTDKERYLATIRGLKHFNYDDINLFFRRYMGWFNAPDTLHFTFEDLTCSSVSQKKVINDILGFLYGPSLLADRKSLLVEQMISNVNPAKAVTFRKGLIGDWKNEFDLEIANAFKEVAGSLLVELGYEKDLNW